MFLSFFVKNTFSESPKNYLRIQEPIVDDELSSISSEIKQKSIDKTNFSFLTIFTHIIGMVETCSLVEATKTQNLLSPSWSTGQALATQVHL
jgi:hypothetical protein